MKHTCRSLFVTKRNHFT